MLKEITSSRGLVGLNALDLHSPLLPFAHSPVINLTSPHPTLPKQDKRQVQDGPSTQFWS